MVAGPDGTDTLSGIELAQFSDATITLVQPGTVSATTVQNDYIGIVRSSLPQDQATTVANAINSGAQTEFQYVNSLLSQVANTTFPAVAVEASMYGAVGTSAEVTALATQFLPAQVENATKYGFNPLVYATEALGLVFAFNNETGSTAFATGYGPSNATMPNSTAGDWRSQRQLRTAFLGPPRHRLWSMRLTTTFPIGRHSIRTMEFQESRIEAQTKLISLREAQHGVMQLVLGWQTILAPSKRKPPSFSWTPLKEMRCILNC